MKRIGFVVSLLVHGLFLALLVRVHFPVKIYPSKPKVIDVIAMFPQLGGKPPPVDTPVVIKPFFLPAQPGGSPGTPGRPGAGRTVPRSSQSPAERSSAARQRSAPPADPAAKEGRPAREEQDQSAASAGLAIDWKKISAQLNDRKTGQRPPPFSGDSQGITALPFEDSFPGRSGDGDESGGGAGNAGSPVSAYGGSAFFDSRGYDITPWAKRVVYRIKQNWIPPLPRSFGLKGRVDIYLVVEKNGQLRGVNLKKSSGIRSFDQAALNALQLSSPFLPLPNDFPNADLPAYLIFRYN